MMAEEKMLYSIKKYLRNQHLKKYGTTVDEMAETSRRLLNNEEVSYEERLKFFYAGIRNMALAKEAADFPPLPELKQSRYPSED